MIRRLFYTLTIICVILLAAYQPSLVQPAEQTHPQITDDILVLRVDDPYQNYDEVDLAATLVPGNELYTAVSRFEHKQLSSSGRYVAARTRIIAASISQPVISASLYTWDLEGSESMMPPLLASIELDVSQALASFTISPDEAHLALYTGGQVQIWQFPDLSRMEAVLELSNESSMYQQAIAWSADSQSLAFVTMDDPAFIQWDWQTDTIYTNTEIADTEDDLEIRDVTPTPGGWIFSVPFVYCTDQMETCIRYGVSDVDKTVFLYSYDAGERVITREVPVTPGAPIDNTTRRTYDWQINESEEYEVTRTLSDPAWLFTQSISPNGRYFRAAVPNTDIVQLRSAENSELLSELELRRGSDFFYWLFDDYYLTLTSELTLKLYSVEENTPLQTFDLQAHPEYEAFAAEVHTNETTGQRHISDNGDRILIDLGGVMVVFKVRLPSGL